MIHETVSASRTVRSFDESRPVSKETLTKIIDTARLSPSAMNAQPIRYRIVTEWEQVEAITAVSRFGAALPERKFPPDNHHPTAYIVVCTDTTVSQPNGRFVMFDAGLACQAITLRAHEEGLGGVILASFDPEKLVDVLSLPERYVPLVAIALGVPDEDVKLVDVGADGSTKYYRNENDTHCVPKRKLEDILL